MKKLMIMLAAVAIGFAAQAAVAVTWQTGTGIKKADGTAFSNGNASPYTATIAFFTDAACTTPFAAGGTLSTSTYATKASKGFNSSTGETFNPGNTYYAVLTLSNGTMEWKSDVAAFTIAAGSLAGPNINFTTGLGTDGGTSLINSNAYTPVGGGVPEPTSGVLMLVGLGALALRRRKA